MRAVSGIIPGVSFPDPLSTIGPVTDCRLLDHFFGPSGNGFTPAQMRAVSGFGSYDTFTAGQQARLRAVFAGGVCDYGRRGAQQVAPRGTWLSYGDGDPD